MKGCDKINVITSMHEEVWGYRDSIVGGLWIFKCVWYIRFCMEGLVFNIGVCKDIRERPVDKFYICYIWKYESLAYYYGFVVYTKKNFIKVYKL